MGGRYFSTSMWSWGRRKFEAFGRPDGAIQTLQISYVPSSVITLRRTGTFQPEYACVPENENQIIV
jgi:hypothetical protein